MSRIDTPPPTPRTRPELTPAGPTSATEEYRTHVRPRGCCEKVMGSFITSIGGCMLYPVALCLLGWNEFQTVCTQKKLAQAADHVHDIDCTDASVLDEYSGDLVFISCSIDKKSRPEWGIEAFPNMGRLAGIFNEEAVAIKQVAEMFQCKETQKTKKGSDGKTEVTYSYSTGWSEDHIDDKEFKYQAEKKNACNKTSNPQFPTTTRTLRASGLSAGLFDMSNEYLESIPTDTRIKFDGLDMHFWQKTTYESVQPPKRPSKFNSVTYNGKIWTCDPFSPPTIGCMRFSYYKASVTHAHVLAELHEHRGRGKFRPWDADPSWGCPANAKVNRLKYFGSGTGTTTHAAVLRELATADAALRWTLRIIGLLLAGFSVFMVFSPITTGYHAALKSARKIPIFGSFLAYFVSFIAGTSIKMLLAVSYGIGLSLAFMVILLVYLLMRPLSGLLLLFLTVCGLARGFLYIGEIGKKKMAEKEKKN